jgi:hypothetical protein
LLDDKIVLSILLFFVLSTTVFKTKRQLIQVVFMLFTKTEVLKRFSPAEPNTVELRADVSRN